MNPTNRPFFRLLIWLVALLAPLVVRAEGTPELQLTAGSPSTFIQIWDRNDPGRLFATYGAPADFRLYVRANAGETVYLGLRQDNNNCFFRVYRPDSVEILPHQAVPTAGPGFISTWNEANAGPSALTGVTGGYNALSFVAPIDGDYWIEINPANSTTPNITKRIIRFFDVTVADGPDASDIKLGRLWSKNWDLQCNGGNNPFDATAFIYSQDSVVTSIDFNGMQPFGFTLVANSTGCENTGDKGADRRSRAGDPEGYPEYPIFLNAPDTLEFPYRETFGNVINTPTITGCDPDDRLINVEVDLAGYVEFLYDVDGAVGYDPGTRDRIISFNVVAGLNSIPWDTRDGLGNLITTTTVDFEVNYFNGLTHLPLYDVENHRFGYIVNLVQPATGFQPEMFWDDRLLTAGTATDGLFNLAGCDPSVTGGCHRWTGRGANCAGCSETINTWWFANTTTFSATIPIDVVQADANTNTPPPLPNDTSICSNQATIQLEGGVTGNVTTTGTWTTTGGSTIGFGNVNDLNTTYTFSATDFTNGFALVILTSTNNGTCPQDVDTMRIEIIPGPTVDAGPPQEVCANNPIVNLGGSVGGAATGGFWSTSGTGEFLADSSSLNGVYSPSPADTTAGSVRLFLTSIDASDCGFAAVDSFDITIISSPIVSAGGDQDVCANSPTLTLAGTVTLASGGGTGAWSRLDGTTTGLVSPASLSTDFTPTTADINAGSVYLILRSTNQAPCATVRDTILVTILPSPVPNAGVNLEICANVDSFEVTGSVTGGTIGSWSTFDGTGTFSPPDSVVTYYIPTTADTTAGSINLVISTATTSGCAAERDTVRIDFSTAPSVLATPIPGKTDNVCANNTEYQLDGTISGTPGATWQEVAPINFGSFLPTNRTIDGTYIPHPNQVSLGISVLALVGDSVDGCKAASDTMFIIYFPAPVPNAGVDDTVCLNNPTIQLSASALNASSTRWDGGNGVFLDAFLNPSRTNNLNGTYEPTAAEILAGSVTLTLYANESGCDSVGDPVTFYFTDPPTADAGPDRRVCANNPTLTLNGSSDVSPVTFGWSRVGGSTLGFVSPASANTSFTALSADTTGPLSLVLSVTDAANGCNAVTDTMIVTFSTSPGVEAGTPISVCSNSPLATLGGTIFNASGATWSSPTTGSFNPSVSSLSATYSPSAADLSNGSVILTLTTTNDSSCVNVSDVVTITYTPSPVVEAGPPQTVCADNPVFTLAGSVTGGSTTGIWTGGTPSGYSNTTDLTGTYTPSVSEISSGSVVLTLTSTANGGCLPVNDNVTLSIVPVTVVEAGPAVNVCDTTSSIVLNGTVSGQTTTGQWIGGGGSFAPSRNSLTATYTPTSGEISAGVVTLFLQSTSDPFCSPVTDSMQITFSTEPTVNVGPDDIVCSGDFPYTLDAVGSPGQWIGGAGTFAPNRTTQSATYTPDVTEIGTTVPLTFQTNASGACPSASDVINLEIKTSPTANAGPADTVCEDAGTHVLASATAAPGASVEWLTGGNGSFDDRFSLNPTYTFTNDDVTDGTINLILRSFDTGCNPAIDTTTLTFELFPTADAGGDQSLCEDVDTVFLVGSAVNGSGSTWSGGAGLFDNTSAPETFYLPDAADVLAGFVDLTLTVDGQDLCGQATSITRITFLTGPTIDAGLDDIVCANDPSVQVSAIVTVAGGVIWSSPTGGTFSPNNTTATVDYFFTDADTTAGFVDLVATTDVNAGCQAVSDTVRIVIQPLPTATLPADLTVCADTSMITLTGSAANNTSVLWSTTGNGTFVPGAANTLPIVYQPDAQDYLDSAITVRLTAVGDAVCNDQSATQIIYFNPAPTVFAGGDRSVCTTDLDVNLFGSVQNATGGEWSIVPTGSGSFDNSASLNAVYTLSPADTVAGSVQLVLSSTGNGLCRVVRDTMQINVVNKPTVDVGPDQTICADSAYLDVSATVLPVSQLGFWSTSGTGSFYVQTDTINASYVPSLADTTAGSVYLKFTTFPGPCTAVSDSFLLIITPAPTINAGPDQTICADQPTITLASTFTVAGGMTWNTSGTGGLSSALDPNAVYTVSALDTTVRTVNFVARTTNNGICKSKFDEMVLTINPIPVISVGPDQTVCANVDSIAFNTTLLNAPGGTWFTTGTGVFVPSADSIDAYYAPSTADKSLPFLQIWFETDDGAIGTCNPVRDTMVLRFDAVPTVSAGDDQTVCSDAGSVALTGSRTNTTSSLWSRVGGGGSFSPSASALSPSYVPNTTDTTAGSVQLVLTSTGITQCSPARDTVEIFFDPLPTLSVSGPGSLCADNEAAAVQATVTGGVGGLWTSSGTGFFSDSTSLSPQYTITSTDSANGSVTLRFTTSGSTCATLSENLTITLTPAPIADAGPDQTVCRQIDSLILSGSGENVIDGFWETDNGTGVFNPDPADGLIVKYAPSMADTLGDSLLFIFTGIGDSPCGFNVDTMKVFFDDNVLSVDAGLREDTVCLTDLPIQLNGSGSAGIWEVLVGDGVFLSTGADTSAQLNAVYIPGPTDSTTRDIQLRLRQPGGSGACNFNADTIDIHILDGPIVSAGVDTTVCGDIAQVPLQQTTLTNLSGGTAYWTTSGSGTFSLDSSEVGSGGTTFYVPSTNDLADSMVTLTLRTKDVNAFCGQALDTKVIYFNEVPTIDAGLTQSLCASDTVQLNGKLTGSVSPPVGTWSTNGDGTFESTAGATSPLLTDRYILGATDQTTDTVTLFLTATLDLCNTVLDSVKIAVQPVVVTDVGVTPDSICSDEPQIQLNGVISSAGGGRWSILSGTGTFAPNSTQLDALYNVTAVDTAAGSVQLRLISEDNGLCSADTADITYVIVPRPVVDAGPNDTICGTLGNFTTLSGDTANAFGSLLWTSSSGHPGFSSDVVVAPTYTPSATDIANGGVVLTLTNNGHPICSARTDNMVLRITPAPAAIVNAGFDQFLCRDIAEAELHGQVFVATGANWSTPNGTGSFFPDTTQLDVFYRPSTADRSLDSIIIVLTTTGNGPLCTADQDTMVIYFTPLPTLDPGPNDTVCADQVSVNLAATMTEASVSQWSTTGAGYFAPSSFVTNVTTTDYFIQPDDTVAGTVGLSLITTEQGSCQPVDTFKLIVINPKPIVNAGLDQEVCSNQDTIFLGGEIFFASGAVWTTSGNGSFVVDTDLNARYVVDPQDVTDSVIVLTLTTTTGFGTCNPVNDRVIIRFYAAPQVEAGPPQSVCADNPNISLNGSVTLTTGIWRTLGTGGFSPNNTTLTATYSPSSADVTAGTVDLVLRSAPYRGCNIERDTLELTIVPKPIVSAGPANCVDVVSGVVLSGSVTNATGGEWSTTTGGLFTPNAFDLGANYKPSSTDITNGTVTIRLTSTGNGLCNAVTDSISLLVKPLPVADGGGDVTVCAGTSTDLVAEPTANVSFAWYTNEALPILLATERTLTVTINTDTSYVLEVTDVDGCVNYDTVQVAAITPPVPGLPDQACYATDLVLDAGITLTPGVDSIGTFTWYRDGVDLQQSNADTLLVKRAGLHVMEYTFDRCTVLDSTDVIPLPIVVSPDKVVCEGATSLDISTTLLGFVSYQWRTNGADIGGATSNTFTVPGPLTAIPGPAVEEDTVFVARVTELNSGLGCFTDDTVFVNVIPEPDIQLVDDSVCFGTVLTLDGRPVNMLALGDDTLTGAYAWFRTGSLISTNQTVIANHLDTTQTIEYIATYTIGECEGRDTASIRFWPLPVPVNEDVVKLCLEEGDAILDAGPATSYAWDSGPLIAPSASQTVVVDFVTYFQGQTDARYFPFSLFNDFACETRDSILVRNVCVPSFFVPTAFTPVTNAPFDEDIVFQLYAKNIRYFRFTIFNRWGEIIYYIEVDANTANVLDTEGNIVESELAKIAWDGTYKGEDMPIGVYPWTLHYEGDSEEFRGPFFRDGSVTLIR